MSDLIRREDLLKNFEDYCEVCFAYTREKKEEVICRRCFIQTVKDIIKESPSVKQERKKGKWMPVESQTVNGRCSVCGYESHLYENDVYGEYYCPNCGAEMLSGEEKDE